MEKNFSRGDAFELVALKLIELGYTVSKTTELNSSGDIKIHDLNKIVRVYGSYTDSSSVITNYSKDLRRNLSKGSRIYDYYVFVRAITDDDIRFFILSAAEMFNLQIMIANAGTINCNPLKNYHVDGVSQNAVKFEDLLPFENKWKTLK